MRREMGRATTGREECEARFSSLGANPLQHLTVDVDPTSQLVFPLL
jgi:hypothetical protein